MTKPRFLALLLCAFVSVLLRWAQTERASIIGSITDKTGAAMEGVAVSITNESTNTGSTVTTDTSCAYTAVNLIPGSYRVNASRQGFRPVVFHNFILQVGQTARLDITLETGQLSESVSITENASPLRTESGSLGQVVNNRKIVDLPLNGRNFVQLAQLIPGVQAGTPGSITVRRGRGSIGQQDAPFGSTAMSANGSRDTSCSCRTASDTNISASFACCCAGRVQRKPHTPEVLPAKARLQ